MYCVQCSMFNCSFIGVPSMPSTPIVLNFCHSQLFRSKMVPFETWKYRKLDCIVCALWKLKLFTTFDERHRGACVFLKPTLFQTIFESNWIHHSQWNQWSHMKRDQWLVPFRFPLLFIDRFHSATAVSPFLCFWFVCFGAKLLLQCFQKLPLSHFFSIGSICKYFTYL